MYKTYPYSEFFWSIFSRVGSADGDLLYKSSYSVQMRKNTAQENSEYGYFLRSDNSECFSLLVKKEYKKILKNAYSREVDLYLSYPYHLFCCSFDIWNKKWGFPLSTSSVIVTKPKGHITSHLLIKSFMANFILCAVAYRIA